MESLKDQQESQENKDNIPLKESDNRQIIEKSRSESQNYSPKKSGDGDEESIKRDNSYANDEEQPEEELPENTNNKIQKDLNVSCPKLDFLIFISTQIKEILVDKKIMDNIIKNLGEISMDFDPNFKIPEYNGCLLRIKGDDIKRKRDATLQLLDFIVNNNLDKGQQNEPKIGEKIAIIIMIPNGLVSMIIGTKGKQISNLINESGASIVINQPIYKMSYRTVTISGYPKNIADGIMFIQKIMEERYNEVQKIEFESPPLNVTTTQTNIKLVFNENVVDHMTSRVKKNMSIIEELQKNCDVTTTIYQDRKNRQIDRKDYICSLKGTIEHVQAAIIELSRKIRRDIRTNFDGRESYQLRILINKVFVTKLIGAGGCMIQEIANFAKGASIKILSNKNDEKKNRFSDIPLCIAGNYSSVQDATCIIIEQMECFKNGGPVLKSGKSLHENIANQFMNSIFTNAGRGQKEDDHIYTLKERFSQNNPHTYSSPNPNELNGEDNKNIEKASQQSNHERKSSKDYYPRENFRKFSNESFGNMQGNRKKSRSRSRSRSKSKERNMRMWERSRSNERNFERSNSKNKEYRNYKDYKDYRDYNKHDYHHSKNQRENNINTSNRNAYSNQNNYSGQFSYLENNVVKINTNFTVPDHLVSLLIGKNGENVRGIMTKTGSTITFGKEYNDDARVNTPNGLARLCNLKGTVDQNMAAMKLIMELIVKYENVTGAEVRNDK